MGRRVLLHRYEETSSGTPRVVESGAFDPDADDNPDWVTEALSNREESQEEEPRLTPWEDALSSPQPASVLDTVEFGEDTSLPDGVDEPVEDDEESEVIDPQPAGVIGSVEFGVETPEPEAAKADDAVEEKPKRAAKAKTEAKRTDDDD